MSLPKIFVPVAMAVLLLANLATANASVSVYSAEDDGSIPLANNAGLGGLFTLHGAIGDGPYGATSGDSDIYN